MKKDKLLCPKHSRILIGKKMCEECVLERTFKGAKPEKMKEEKRRIKCRSCGKLLKRTGAYRYACKCMPGIELLVA